MTDSAHHQISRREYFAAHAPTDIPGWFKPDFRPPPRIPCASELSPQHRKQWDGLGDWVEEHEAAPEVLAFRDRYNAALQAQDRYETEFARAQYIAWRWQYADMMAAAALPTASHAGDAQIETALCVWEFLHEHAETNPDIQRYRAEIGTVELRIAAIRLAAFCNDVFSRLPDSVLFERTFDWDIVPAILDTIDWQARPVLPPSLNASVEAVKTALTRPHTGK